MVQASSTKSVQIVIRASFNGSGLDIVEPTVKEFWVGIVMIVQFFLSMVRFKDGKSIFLVPSGQLQIVRNVTANKRRNGRIMPKGTDEKDVAGGTEFLAS